MSAKCRYPGRPLRTAKLLLVLSALPCLALVGTVSARASTGQVAARAQTVRAQYQKAMMPSMGGVWTLSLAASPTALLPGQSSALTARATPPTGMLPGGTWYLHIADVSGSSAADVAVCGIPSCQAAVSEPVATEQEYVAYVSDTRAPISSGLRFPAGGASVIVDWRYFIRFPF
jgi:hypothetical protein